MTVSSSSLRNKLLWTAAALVLIPGLLAGWLADRSARTSLQEVIGRQLAREAAHTAERISAQLRAEHRALESVARQDLMRELRVADLDKRIAQALVALRTARPERLDYVALDPAREVVAATRASLLGPAPEWVQRALDQPAARPERADQHFALAIRERVPDPDGGEPLGWLVGRLDWQIVEGVMGALKRDLAQQGIDARIAVVDAAGTALADGADRPLPSRHLLGSEAGWGVDTAGGVIAGWAALSADAPPWRLVVVEPLRHAMAPARALTQRLALTLGAALAAALAIGAFGSGRVIRPLTELTRAIRAVPRERPEPVPVRSRDEVGALAEAFNAMARDLGKAQHELVEAEKFAFVGQLASGVAHEVRTSLGVLRSSTQMLERSLPDGGDARVSELAQMIRAEVDRLGGVVDDLLTLDRPRALRLESVDAAEIAERSVAFVTPRAEQRGVQLLYPSAAELRLRADPDALQQAIVNLLVNAIGSVEPGGRVRIELEPGAQGGAAIVVRDDGPGIDPDLRERIFEPFVTRREGGVGLGLTFVLRVAQQHGGRVTLVAGLPRDGGEGAGFRLEVPGRPPATGAP